MGTMRVGSINHLRASVGLPHLRLLIRYVLFHSLASSATHSPMRFGTCVRVLDLGSRVSGAERRTAEPGRRIGAPNASPPCLQTHAHRKQAMPIRTPQWVSRQRSHPRLGASAESTAYACQTGSSLSRMPRACTYTQVKVAIEVKPVVAQGTRQTHNDDPQCALESSSHPGSASEPTSDRLDSISKHPRGR